MTFHEQLARATAGDRDFLLAAPIIQRSLAGDVTRIRRDAPRVFAIYRRGIEAAP